MLFPFAGLEHILHGISHDGLPFYMRPSRVRADLTMYLFLSILIYLNILIYL